MGEADENGQVNVVVADDMERPTACVQVAYRRPPRHEDVSEAEVAERVQQVFGYLFASGPCAPLSLLGPMFRVRRQQLVETGLELARMIRRRDKPSSGFRNMRRPASRKLLQDPIQFSASRCGEVCHLSAPLWER